MKNWINKQFRKKSRVYIFPTRMGGYLNGLIFLMFLLSIGYSNNLLLIFTTFLLGFNLLWLVQSHFHLERLKFGHLKVANGHAGQRVEAQVFWKKSPKGPVDWELTIESDQGDFKISQGETLLPHRGEYFWKYLKVKTNYPFGLYNTWIYFPLRQSTLVYPTLLPIVELPLSGKEMEGELWQDKNGADDFRGLNNYSGEEARKISWKHYARSGELFIKEGEDKKSPIMDLNLVLPSDAGLKEIYLCAVATQLVECSRREIPFTLRASGLQSSFLPDCLKLLARC